MIYLLFAIIALCSGIIGALVGLGGGTILVPATLFFGLELGLIPDITPQKVVGLSVIMMIFTGLSSTLSYMKDKLVDYKSGFILFIGSIPGVMIGAWINKGLDLSSFNLYFGILLMFISILLMVRDKLKPVYWFVEHGTKTEYIDPSGNRSVYGYPIWFAILLSVGVGILSGLFGIGGGTIIVPALILLFLFPPRVAVATSMFLVFLTSIINSASHIYLGNVPWVYTIPVIIGAYIGAKLGAMLNRKMKSKTIVLILQIVMVFMGIRLFIEGL